jgi:sigma-B regulation protein RsbU (phosphoserine phosphatase)
VEGAARVLDAHGGALYMMERAGGKLAPAYISRGCPPFVEVPADVLQKAATLLRRWRLSESTHDPPGVGLDRPCLQTREAVCLTDLANAPELAHSARTHSVRRRFMVTPLPLREAKMGVLALANWTDEYGIHPERLRRLQVDR